MDINIKKDKNEDPQNYYRTALVIIEQTKELIQEDQMRHRIFCPLSGAINVPFVSIGSMDTCIVCTASSLTAVMKRDH